MKNWWKQMTQKLKQWASPKKMTEAARRSQGRGQTKYQESNLRYRVRRDMGPMVFLGDQIVKRMERSGYPAKIHKDYRSPEAQNHAHAHGVSQVQAWGSAHQYYEGLDIVHKALYWEAPRAFWEQLARVVRVVAKEYGVGLRHGHDWDGDGIPVYDDPDESFYDGAHVELTSWREVPHRQLLENSTNWKPTAEDLFERFKEVLPSEAPEPNKENTFGYEG